VLFHGFRGVWTWLDESVHRPSFRVVLFCALVVLGAALAILGTVTILPFRAS
jgi:succinate dehydrogenase hydrophobic anchor subunit